MGYGLYFKYTFDRNVILACLYVDGIQLTRSYSFVINKFKKVLMNVFYMTDFRNMVYFLGMKILCSIKGNHYAPTKV